MTTLFTPLLALALLATSTMGCVKQSPVAPPLTPPSPQAPSSSSPCPFGEQQVTTDTLYFGTAMQGGVVSKAEWAAFLNENVAPGFPEGFTTWAASGQWRMADGAIERETSHVLQLTYNPTPAREAAVRRIMSQYKKTFRQEAVMRIRSVACRSF